MFQSLAHWIYDDIDGEGKELNILKAYKLFIEPGRVEKLGEIKLCTTFFLTPRSRASNKLDLRPRKSSEIIALMAHLIHIPLSLKLFNMYTKRLRHVHKRRVLRNFFW